MSLIIEDGSIVSGANSYVTLIEAREYASARGVTLPADDAACEVHLNLAIDYLESQRARYQGTKVDSSQALQFPRDDVYIDGVEQSSSSIPDLIKYAQMQLAIENFNGIILQPTSEKGFAIREKVDVIETEYSEKIGTSKRPQMSKVSDFLTPLFSASSSVYSLRSVRV